MISPTGKGIRISDALGMGRYGAPRGDRRHLGTDYVCTPGQNVVAPIAGIVEREARPYVEGHYSGVLISARHMSVKMFYFKPKPGIIGKAVVQGDTIGTAQDISKKKKDYKGMIPHVHLEIISIDPAILTEML